MKLNLQRVIFDFQEMVFKGQTGPIKTKNTDESVRSLKWRRRRDSNSSTGIHRSNRLATCPLRPLGYASAKETIQQREGQW